MSSLLENGLAEAHQLVFDRLLELWPVHSPYRDSLMADVGAAYATASSELRRAAAAGYRSGLTSMLRMVAAAILSLGFRNEMTVEVAPVRRAGEAVLADVTDSGWLVKWVCRKDAKGIPDARVCHWCRELDAMPAIPLGSEFPSGTSDHGRRPPRVYFNLRCPPRHPRCRCHIILVRADDGRDAEEGVDQATASSAPFISSDDIRDMDPDDYNALTDFHRAALHELGQVIRRHRQGLA